MIFSLNIYDWYNLSFDELTTLAKEKNDANAQYQLGLIYHKGEMVEQDNTKAMQWFEEVAIQGNVNAQFELAWLYNDEHEYQ